MTFQTDYRAVTTNNQELIQNYIKEGWQIFQITVNNGQLTYHLVWLES